jgi:flagellar basal-body rod protein FlgG
MLRSLYTAATGMKANQTYVDNIAHNLSNVNTTGYKKSKIEFEDLIYQNLQLPGSENADGIRRPVGIQVGLGSRVLANQKIFTQGNFQQTGNPFDFAINGDGFFQIRLPTGETAYTRSGSFKVSDEGYLTTSQGYLVEPSVVMPDDMEEITVSESGLIAMRRVGEAAFEEVGQFELARFVNPAGLQAMGGNLYRESEASGTPLIGDPGSNSLGVLNQQYIEASNVQMVEEMVNMIIAQRGYEISSKAITTSDEMLQTASALKR